jgi:hypothetical protein
VSRSLRGRLEQLEQSDRQTRTRRVTIWDVLLGGADPDDLDPADRDAVLAIMSPGPPERTAVDEIEERIAAVLSMRHDPGAIGAAGGQATP